MQALKILHNGGHLFMRESCFHSASKIVHQENPTFYRSIKPGARLNDRLQCNPLGNYTVTYISLSGVDGQNMSVPATSCNPNCSSFIDVKDSYSTFYNVSVSGIGIPRAFQIIGCVVSFGTSPDYLPYTLTTFQSGGVVRTSTSHWPLMEHGTKAQSVCYA